MRRTILSALAAVWLMVPAGGWAQGTLPREEVERIVRDYLLREPQVIYDAIQILQKRREADAAERAQAVIAEREDEIFRSSADPILGDPQGDVTLVEFFDYRCGYCRNMAASLQGLVAEDRRLRFVLKEFPILGPESTVAAKAALAAKRQGKYAELHFALMQTKDLTEPAILALAEARGLDANRLQRDMASPAIAEALDANRELAEALGITGTPSFIIGEKLIGGAAPIGDLVSLIAAQRREGG